MSASQLLVDLSIEEQQLISGGKSDSPSISKTPAVLGNDFPSTGNPFGVDTHGNAVQRLYLVTAIRNAY
jgi:hypothetical protein